MNTPNETKTHMRHACDKTKCCCVCWCGREVFFLFWLSSARAPVSLCLVVRALFFWSADNFYHFARMYDHYFFLFAFSQRCSHWSGKYVKAERSITKQIFWCVCVWIYLNKFVEFYAIEKTSQVPAYEYAYIWKG